MATYEQKGHMTYKDDNGDKHIMYPVTKIECVDGLEEALASLGDSSGITIVHITVDGYKADTSFSEIVEAKNSGQTLFALVDLYGGYPFYYLGTISHDGVSCARFQYMKYIDSTLTGMTLNGMDVYIDDEKNAIFEGFDLYPVGSPYTASVGQTIAVKSVNEKGFPIEWEAVDAGSGSGIYADEEEPADAPDGTLWLDTDENGEVGSDLPEFTEEDNGKVLMVTADGLAWVTPDTVPDGEEMTF